MNTKLLHLLALSLLTPSAYGAQQVITPGAGVTAAAGRDMINANFAELYGLPWYSIVPSANGASLVSAANYAAMRALLDLEPDTDFPTIASVASTYVPITRTINGSALSADITVTAAAGTLTGSTLNATVTGSSLTSVGVLAGLTSSAAIEARNGATAVPIYAYNTYTSGTSYERGAMVWASNILKIGTEKGSGGGTARALALMTDATSRWTVGATTGHLVPVVASSYEFGSVSLPVGTIYSNGIRVYNAGGSRLADFFSYSTNIGLNSSAMVRWESTSTITGANDLGMGRNAAGVAEINSGTAGAFRDLRVRSIIAQPPATITPASNGDMVFEATSNTSVTLKMKGTDGTVRSVVLTLAP